MVSSDANLQFQSIDEDNIHTITELAGTGYNDRAVGRPTIYDQTLFVVVVVVLDHFNTTVLFHSLQSMD